MNKKEFVKEVAQRSSLNEYAIDEMYNMAHELIVEKMIHGENVEIPRLGTFVLNKKNAKNLFGSQNNADVCIYPYFKMNDKLKTRIKDARKFRKNP